MAQQPPHSRVVPGNGLYIYINVGWTSPGHQPTETVLLLRAALLKGTRSSNAAAKPSPPPQHMPATPEVWWLDAIHTSEETRAMETPHLLRLWHVARAMNLWWNAFLPVGTL